MLPTIATGNVGSALAGEYEVANSLRFDGSSDYLNRTPSSASNRKTFTFSAWCKFSKYSSVDTLYATGSDSNNRTIFIRNGAQNGDLRFLYSVGGTQYNVITSAFYRDFSAWYHIVLAVDTTQSTSSNRVKIYVNGEQITAFSTENYLPQNNDTDINNTNAHHIGRYTYSAINYMDGYMAEVCFIDGTALDPTSFGEFDEDTNIWKPKDVSGLTFGTNGFYLDFQNSGSLGADVSGNGNNFTVNNLTSIDQTTDTCTNNFATMNPLDTGTSTTFSDGNTILNFSQSAGTYNHTLSTIGFNSGKWYWECKISTTANAGGCDLGIIPAFNYPDNTRNTYLTANGNFKGVAFRFRDDRNIYFYTNTDGFTLVSGETWSDNDIIGIAYDSDNGKLYIFKNGTELSGQTISTNTALHTALSLDDFALPVSSFGDGGAGTIEHTARFNFGNPPFTISSGNSDGNGYGNFEYSVPSGYYALNSKNLAEYG